MSVDDQEMLIVEGRLIAPPEVKYISGRDGQSEVVERINIGKFVFEKFLFFFYKFIFILKMEYSKSFSKNT